MEASTEPKGFLNLRYLAVSVHLTIQQDSYLLP